MITNIRIELDDHQRNILSRAIYPDKPKRLATRKDVADYVGGCLSAATVTDPALAMPPSRNGQLSVIMDREMNRDPQLVGKSDSYIRGWCKVKFAHELR